MRQPCREAAGQNDDQHHRTDDERESGDVLQDVAIGPAVHEPIGVANVGVVDAIELLRELATRSRWPSARRGLRAGSKGPCLPPGGRDGAASQRGAT